MLTMTFTIEKLFHGSVFLPNDRETVVGVCAHVYVRVFLMKLKL